MAGRYYVDRYGRKRYFLGSLPKGTVFTLPGYPFCRFVLTSTDPFGHHCIVVTEEVALQQKDYDRMVEAGIATDAECACLAGLWHSFPGKLGVYLV